MSTGMRIGLTGKAGAGKGVVADYLVEQHGFTKVSFAGPLKKMLLTLNPIVGVSDDSPVYLEPLLGEPRHENSWTELDVKAEFPEYRRLLQVLGTDCIRALDDTFWVRAAMQQITAKGNYIFDDCRFPNESAAIKKTPTGTLWNIIREGHDGGAGSHSSEQWAGNMNEDLRIHNSRTIAELHAQVDTALDFEKRFPRVNA